MTLAEAPAVRSSLLLRFFWGDRDEPLANERVRFRVAYGAARQLSGEFTTDASGEHSLDLPDAATARCLHLFYRGAREAALSLQPSRGALDVILEPIETAQWGQLVTPKGLPLPCVQISVEGKRQEFFGSRTSDAQGVVDLSGLDPGHYTFRVHIARVTTNGVRRANLRAEAEILEGQEEYTLEVPLRNEFRILAVDEANAPIEDCLMSLRAVRKSRFASRGWTMLNDCASADSVIQLDRTNSLEILAMTQNHDPMLVGRWSTEKELSGPLEAITVKLTPRERIRLYLVDASGSPVTDAYLRVEPGTPLDQLPRGWVRSIVFEAVDPLSGYYYLYRHDGLNAEISLASSSGLLTLQSWKIDPSLDGQVLTLGFDGMVFGRVITSVGENAIPVVMSGPEPFRVVLTTDDGREYPSFVDDRNRYAIRIEPGKAPARLEFFAGSRSLGSVERPLVGVAQEYELAP